MQPSDLIILFFCSGLLALPAIWLGSRIQRFCLNLPKERHDLIDATNLFSDFLLAFSIVMGSSAISYTSRSVPVSKWLAFGWGALEGIIIAAIFLGFGNACLVRYRYRSSAKIRDDDEE